MRILSLALLGGSAMLAVKAENPPVSGASVSLVVENVYSNSTTCTGSTPRLSVIGLPETCMQLSTDPRVSLRYTCKDYTVFAGSDTCAGTGTTASYACLPRVDLASTLPECATVPGYDVFIVEYYPNSSCTGPALNYRPSSTFFSSGILGVCLTYPSGQSYLSSVTKLVDNSLVSNYFDGEGCQGQSKSETTTPLGGTCNRATGSAASSSTPFFVARLLATKPNILYGNVNLNADATSLNAQIVGASVGVLCGITALLVLLSTTGLIG